MGCAVDPYSIRLQPNTTLIPKCSAWRKWSRKQCWPRWRTGHSSRHGRCLRAPRQLSAHSTSEAITGTSRGPSANCILEWGWIQSKGRKREEVLCCWKRLSTAPTLPAGSALMKFFSMHKKLAESNWEAPGNESLKLYTTFLLPNKVGCDKRMGIVQCVLLEGGPHQKQSSGGGNGAGKPCAAMLWLSSGVNGFVLHVPTSGPACCWCRLLFC